MIFFMKKERHSGHRFRCLYNQLFYIGQVLVVLKKGLPCLFKMRFSI